MIRDAGVAELADALDSKSSPWRQGCGFDSLLRHDSECVSFQPMKVLKVKSELGQLEKIRNFLKENLSVFRLSEEEYFKIELALVEICTNIVRYAYPEGDGHILLKTWHEDLTIYLEIRDDGIPFDPTRFRDWDIEDIITKEHKGGLGIFLARKLMDGFSYRRQNDQNVLTMHKKASRKKT
jgi:anti-sigma regulatory factor (Ser/Thr protein kinase)